MVEAKVIETRDMKAFFKKTRMLKEDIEDYMKEKKKRYCERCVSRDVNNEVLSDLDDFQQDIKKYTTLKLNKRKGRVVKERFDKNVRIVIENFTCVHGHGNSFIRMERIDTNKAMGQMSERDMRSFKAGI